MLKVLTAFETEHGMVTADRYAFGAEQGSVTFTPRDAECPKVGKEGEAAQQEEGADGAEWWRGWSGGSVCVVVIDRLRLIF